MGSAPVSTATPGLAVNAGRLSNCASSCQMARPVLCFYRATNQCPGKREDLSQCAAIQLGLKPKAQVHSRALCGSQMEHAHKKRGGGSGHSRYLETGTALGSHSSGFSLCLANRLVADAFPASCEEDRGDLQQNAAARRRRPLLTRRLISTHGSRMQACVSDAIYTTANTFTLGVKENTDKENKQQLHPVTGEPAP